MSVELTEVKTRTRAEKQREYRRAWELRNPEKVKAKKNADAKRHRARHQERRKRKWSEYYAQNRERLLANRRVKRASPEVAAKERAYRDMAYARDRAKLLYRGARNRAKLLGVEFAIQYSDVHLPEKCPVLGMPFNLIGKRGDSRYSPTIDRINPKRGYVPGNIMVISFRANQIKNDASAAEIRAVADFYTKLDQEAQVSTV